MLFSLILFPPPLSISPYLSIQLEIANPKKMGGSISIGRPLSRLMFSVRNHENGVFT